MTVMATFQQYIFIIRRAIAAHMVRTHSVLSGGAIVSENSHALMAMQAMSSVRDWPSMGEAFHLHTFHFFRL